MADETGTPAEAPAEKPAAKPAEDANKGFLRRAKEQIGEYGRRTFDSLKAEYAEAAETGMLAARSADVKLKGTADVSVNITPPKASESIQKVPPIEKVPDIVLSFTKINTGLGQQVDRVLQKSQDEVKGAISQTYNVLKDRVGGIAKTITVMDRNVQIVDVRTKRFQSEASDTIAKLQGQLTKLSKSQTDYDVKFQKIETPEKKDVEKGADSDSLIENWLKFKGVEWLTKALAGALPRILGLGSVGAIGTALYYAEQQRQAAGGQGPWVGGSRFEDQKGGRRIVGGVLDWLEKPYSKEEQDKFRQQREQAESRRRQDIERGAGGVGPTGPTMYDESGEPYGIGSGEWWKKKTKFQPGPTWAPGAQQPTGLFEDIGSLFGGTAQAAERPPTSLTGTTARTPDKIAVEKTEVNLSAKESIFLKGTLAVNLKAPKITIEADEIVFKGKVTGLPEKPAMAQYGMAPRGGGLEAMREMGATAMPIGAPRMAGYGIAPHAAPGGLGEYFQARAEPSRGEVAGTGAPGEVGTGIPTIATREDISVRDQSAFFGPGAVGIPEQPGAFGMTGRVPGALQGVGTGGGFFGTPGTTGVPGFRGAGMGAPAAVGGAIPTAAGVTPVTGAAPAVAAGAPVAKGRSKEPPADMGASRMAGVDPLLIDSIRGGAIKAFGDPSDPKTRYVVNMQGGVRPGSPRHTPGKAVDLQIYDRQTQQYIGGDPDIMKSAYGNPYTYRMYETLAQARYQYTHEKYGEETANRTAWGGRFSARQGQSQYGSATDSMHFSLDEGQKYGGPITGPAKEPIQQWLQKYGQAPSTGITDVKGWKSPYAGTVAGAVAAPAAAAPVTPVAPGGGGFTGGGATAGVPTAQVAKVKEGASDRQQAITAFANKYGMHPSALAGVLQVESGLRPSIKGGAGGGYSGIFQLQHSQIPGMTEKAGFGRLSPDQYRQLSFSDQLKVMDAYYQTHNVQPGFFTGDPKTDSAKAWALQLSPGAAKSIDYSDPNAVISRSAQAGTISTGGIVTVGSASRQTPTLGAGVMGASFAMEEVKPAVDLRAAQAPERPIDWTKAGAAVPPAVAEKTTVEKVKEGAQELVGIKPAGAAERPQVEPSLAEKSKKMAEEVQTSLKKKTEGLKVPAMPAGPAIKPATEVTVTKKPTVAEAQRATGHYPGAKPVAAPAKPEQHISPVRIEPKISETAPPMKGPAEPAKPGPRREREKSNPQSGPVQHKGKEDARQVKQSKAAPTENAPATGGQRDTGSGGGGTSPDHCHFCDEV